MLEARIKQSRFCTAAARKSDSINCQKCRRRLSTNKRWTLNHSSRIQSHYRRSFTKETSTSLGSSLASIAMLNSLMLVRGSVRQTSWSLVKQLELMQPAIQQRRVMPWAVSILLLATSLHYVPVRPCLIDWPSQLTWWNMHIFTTMVGRSFDLADILN